MPDTTDLLDAVPSREDHFDTSFPEPSPETVFPVPAPAEEKQTMLPYWILGLMFLTGIVVFFLR